MIHELIPIGSPGYGGYFAGICAGNLLILSSKKYEKDLNWDEAIEYCKKLEINGYSDWILPTKDELVFIYGNKYKLEKTAEVFATSYYWSSSESSNTLAWHMHFSNGHVSYYHKAANNYVRAVRRLKLSDFIPLS